MAIAVPRLIIITLAAALLGFGAVSLYHWRAEVLDALSSDQAKLERWFFDLDYRRGIAEAHRKSRTGLLETSKPQVMAWLAAHEGFAGHRAHALALADRLEKSHPESPWVHFANAAALIYVKGADDRAIAEARTASTEMPNEVAATWLHAETLRLRHRYSEANALIVSADPKGSNGLLQGERAALAFEIALSKRSSGKDVSEGVALFRQATALPDRRVRNQYLWAWYLKSFGRTREALDLLRDAAAATRSGAVHKSYWATLQDYPNLSTDEKFKEFEADLNRQLADARPTADTIAAAVDIYAAGGYQKEAGELLAGLKKNYPDSEELARVDLNRIQGQVSAALGKRGATGLSSEDRSRLFAIGSSADFSGTELPERAHSVLVDVLMADPSASKEEVHRVARWLTERGRYGQFNVMRAARLLNARQSPLEAQRIAVKGILEIDDLAAKADGLPADRRQLYKQEYLGVLYAAYGQALLQLNARRAGIENLLKGHALKPDEVDTLQRLGDGYTEGGEFEKAEQWYLRCLATPTVRSNPCSGSLREMFLKRGGKLAQFDAYMEAVAPRLAAVQRERIANSAVREGASVGRQPVDLSLTGLDGRTYNLRQYRGRPVVLAIWALWCDICRVQLPKLDQLARDPRLKSLGTILTIQDASDPVAVREWVKQRQLSLPVLDGKGFLESAQITSLPTTWILDKDGRRVFEIVGLPPSMDAEILLRLKALDMRR